jgi:hypothetical protein
MLLKFIDGIDKFSPPLTQTEMLSKMVGLLLDMKATEFIISLMSRIIMHI